MSPIDKSKGKAKNVKAKPGSAKLGSAKPGDAKPLAPVNKTVPNLEEPVSELVKAAASRMDATEPDKVIEPSISTPSDAATQAAPIELPDNSPQVPIKSDFTASLDPEARAKLKQEHDYKQLLADLLKTKKGLFARPERRLVKDIAKRFGVRSRDALMQDNLMAYANVPEIRNVLAKVREARAKSEEAARRKFEAMNSKLEKSMLPLDSKISSMLSHRLLALLLQTKKGLFGDPKKKLSRDISKRLSVREDEAFARENLLKYSRFKDVAKRLDKLLAKRQKEQRKVAKRTAGTVRFVAPNAAVAQLFSDLLKTHKGFFGKSENRLRKSIMKRMGVSGEDAFKTEIVLAYSAQDDIAKKLKKLRAKRDKAGKGGSAAKLDAIPLSTLQGAPSLASTLAGPQQVSVGPQPVLAGPQPVLAGPQPGPTAGVIDVGPEPKALIERLIATKKAVFGSAEVKLRKDIAKQLKVPESEALNETNLVAYSQLPGVQKSLKNADQKFSKGAAAKVKMPQVQPRSEIPKPELYVPPSFSSDVTERAKKLQQIIAEQKQLEAIAAQKKARRSAGIGRAMSLPLVLPAKIIKRIIGKLTRILLVLSITIVTIPLNLGKLVTRLVGGIIGGVSRRVGSFSPFGWKKKINQLVIYSGANKTQEEITGIVVVNGAIVAALMGLAAFFLFNFGAIPSIITAVGSFAAVWIVAYVLLNIMADKRTDEVEGTLPVVLQIVSANISAGMTPYNALWVSARKEFGALAEEIKVAQKEVLGGKAFADALTDMSKRVRSNILQRTIRLLIQGMKAGGELPQILQGIGTDIRQMRLLQKEMAASTMSYTMFILFGMVLGAPLLFSVSIQFVDIMNRFQPETMDMDTMSAAQSGAPAGVGMQGFNVMSLGGGGCPRDFDRDGLPDKWEKENGLSSKNSSDATSKIPGSKITYLEEYQKTAEPLPGSCITAGYLSTFAMIALLSIAFFGSILIGLIRDGKQSAGLKIAPLLVVATLGMFWLMNAGMGFFFGSMFAT